MIASAAVDLLFGLLCVVAGVGLYLLHELCRLEERAEAERRRAEEWIGIACDRARERDALRAGKDFPGAPAGGETKQP